MTQSEGRRIPTVQPESIEAARLLPYTFAMLKMEQHFLGGWLSKRFTQREAAYKDAGEAVPMAEVKDEVYLAYGAMQHAYGSGLPVVQERTIIDYFKGLCPNSALDPDTGKPFDSVDPDTIDVVLDDFEREQPHLAYSIKRRFFGQEYQPWLVDSAATLIGMAYFMIKEEVVLLES